MSVRVSYWSKLEKKNKYITTKLSIHDSREAAKKFIEDKKEKAIMKEERILAIRGEEAKEPKEPKDLDAQSVITDEKVETTDEPEDPLPAPDTTIDNQQQIDDPNMTHNLMDQDVASTPELDRIVANLKFSPFKLEVDPDETGSSITIFGSSKSYKTTLLKRILKKYYSKDTITVLCAPNAHAKIYQDLPKEIIKTDAYCPDIVKAMYMVNKNTDNKYPFVVVLDDVIDKKNDGDLEKLYLTLRNAKISVITLLQNIQLLKSTSRGNSNIVIFRKFNQANAVEDYVMKMYLANFYPFRDLKMADKVSLYMKITNGSHDFFVLDVLNNTLTLHHEPELHE